MSNAHYMEIFTVHTILPLVNTHDVEMHPQKKHFIVLRGPRGEIDREEKQGTEPKQAPYFHA